MEKVSRENTLNEKRNYMKVVLFSCLFVFIFASYGMKAKSAQAQSLYFSPSAGSYAVDQNFTVGVYVSSSDQAMNAADGVISFPKDMLEVTSLSKNGSIFNLWVQEPSSSNALGTVNFEGIILNPGFTGSAGKIITVNFRTKAAGNAHITFSSGSVLANDGKGTNILSSLGDALFSVNVPATGPQAPQATTPSEITGVPLAPKISSPTHPDPEKWCADNDPEFEWSLPKGTKGVNILADKNPNTNPGIRSDGVFSSYTYEDVDDDVWYFHVRLKNAAGWGGISHFRFQVDTKPPEPFSVKFSDGKETEDPRPTITVDHKDTLSGIIGHCDIKIDEGEWIPSNYETMIEKPDEPRTFRLPLQGPGKHTVLVKAFDKAGNYAVATEEFTIKPLELPTITDYPHELQSGKALIVKGSTYPGAQVVIWLQKGKDDPQSQTVQSDNNGDFTFVAGEKLQDGIYHLWAEVIDGRGARSGPTEKLTIAIEQPAVLKACSSAVSFLAVIIPLVALILLLISLLWFGWYRFSLMRRGVKKEVGEAERALHKAFDLLKEEVRDQIELLEKVKTKRKLTEEEKKIVRQLRKYLDNAEKFIRKEIEDIGKEVE